MATEVVMPQMGESIAEGTITRWLVKVGDKVERDQPLFEISTDKVDAEIPSPAAGTLLEIRNQEGETVPVNQVVASIGEAGAQPAAEAAAPAAAPAPAVEAPAPAPSQEVKREETAREEPAPAAAPAPAPAPQAASPAPAASEKGEESLEERQRKFSSPLVRNIASKEGVNLEEVSGTGAQGRVTKDDILGYLEQRKTAPAAPAAAAAPSAPAAAPAPAPASPAPAASAPAPAASRPAGGFHVPAYTANENVEIEPMSKIRQITAAHMVYSKATSAHVTTVFHIDFSKVARARARAKDGFFKKEGTKLSYMPFIFKAVATALKAHKSLNAAVDGTNIVYKKDINLGMAVDMGSRGLIVPVIKHADQLSLVGLAKTANDLADRARGKKLKPEETQGGTFTITNPGVFGSLFGTPIINQPQVAILGIGAVEKRPIVVEDADGNDAIVIKTMSYLAITYDHRLVDGADADRFMIDVKKVIEQDTWTELESYL
ncbi:MAG TPA: dihydrolipoamide acetyltransferase family protein [Thermoanaerobaculia bacterium]|jgi:2-oxoglutarate dehydrogenase E2 component (dihydrolipoamide succinyltransferase)|nr:dihydrolipoamide acetyltransferase family protein [Thermoanaerobaculia bacterium]